MFLTGKDIRVTNTLLEMKSCKQGGLMTLGIDKDTYKQLSNDIVFNRNEYVVVAYIVNINEFEAERNRKE